MNKKIYFQKLMFGWEIGFFGYTLEWKYINRK